MIDYDSKNFFIVFQIFPDGGSVYNAAAVPMIIVSLIVLAVHLHDVYLEDHAMNVDLRERTFGRCKAVDFCNETEVNGTDVSLFIDNADQDLDCYALSLEPTVHSLVGIALGFLLVFRSNLSYGRYWEGRGHLGNGMRRCRDIGRQANTMLYRHSATVDKIKRYLYAYMALLRNHLRKQTSKADLDAINEEVDSTQILTDKEIEILDNVKRQPLWIIQQLTLAIRETEAQGITKQQIMAMDHNIGELITAFNGADKVRNVPLPFPYAQLLVILLSIYCFTMPFVFVGYYHSIVPQLFCCTMITLIFFGINAVGVEIEDPFGDDANDLPVDGMVKKLWEDLECCESANAVDVGTLRGNVRLSQFLNSK